MILRSPASIGPNQRDCKAVSVKWRATAAILQAHNQGHAKKGSDQPRHSQVWAGWLCTWGFQPFPWAGVEELVRLHNQKIEKYELKYGRGKRASGAAGLSALKTFQGPCSTKCQRKKTKERCELCRMQKGGKGLAGWSYYSKEQKWPYIAKNKLYFIDAMRKNRTKSL